MGEINAKVNNYLANRERFADAINVGLFHGKQFVCANDLHELDTKSWNKNAKEYIRDQLKCWRFGETKVILGIEAEQNIQYSMPARMMNYDALTLHQEIQEIKAQHRKKKDLPKREYVSGFSYKDTLCPVLSMVLYLGKEHWDAPCHLSQLLDFDQLPDEIRNEVEGNCNDYQIHVLDVNTLESSDMFQSDLREVIGFLIHQKDKTQLYSYIRNNENFHHLKEDAYDVIVALGNIKGLDIRMERYEQKGEIDMCQAIEELMQDNWNEGHAAGLSEDRERIARLIQKLSEDNRLNILEQVVQDCNILEELMREYSIS
nr:Rpn family recombination-promoting nuclease/putative transposase [Eubacterium sp.]